MVLCSAQEANGKIKMAKNTITCQGVNKPFGIDRCGLSRTCPFFSFFVLFCVIPSALIGKVFVIVCATYSGECSIAERKENRKKTRTGWNGHQGTSCRFSCCFLPKRVAIQLFFVGVAVVAFFVLSWLTYIFSLSQLSPSKRGGSVLLV